MPELPEVEVFKRFIDRHGLHKSIQKVAIQHPKILKHANAADVEAAMAGGRLESTVRRGKYLFVALQQTAKAKQHLALPWFCLHFGMTGYLGFTGAPGQAQPEWRNAYGDSSKPRNHVRVQFDFEDGSTLYFHEQRLFGYLMPVADPNTFCAEKRLGPDALTVSQADFLERLTPRKGQIKPVLMDQSVVAGIGNVYADEILFQCGVHPEALLSSLSPESLTCLHQQTLTVLQNTVDVGADRDQLPSGYLLHTRHKKGHCPKDGTLLQAKIIGGRNTYFCPTCQPISH